MSRPSSGQKIDRPVSVSPWMIAQLIELGPRVQRQERGMVLNGAAARCVDDFIRNDVGDVGHDAEVGIERSEHFDAF